MNIATNKIVCNVKLVKNCWNKFYNYILEIKPKRVIFNLGTKNIELEELLFKNVIAFERSCTLVLLRIGEY